MRFVHKVIISLVLLAMSFLVGYWWRQPGIASVNKAVRQPLYYRDPMHPAYKSDKPGIAPDCGMQLEPVYAGDSTAASDSSDPLSPGTVRIGMKKQQIIGLKTAKVTRASGLYTLRVLGRVAADETRVYRVTAGGEGVIRSVSPYAAGNVVQKDALLAEYFMSAREVYSALQTYVTALSALDRATSLDPNAAAADGAKAQVRLAEELLQTYGLTETQIGELARTRQITNHIEFRAPVTGLILSRNAALGQRVERNGELFRIADLTRVWVLADLFENDSLLISPGSAARVRYQGRTYRASIRDARQFDPASRTLKFRLELENPDFVLRPDMFVDVEFDVREPEGIRAPIDAVLDSGRHKVVFVSDNAGAFEPREVVTGARYGDRVQIVKGLEDGDSIVVSGLFLLDSESRLQLAAAKSSPAHQAAVKAAGSGLIDPVCGMAIDPAKAGFKSAYEGASYYFCSELCKRKFDRNPAGYSASMDAAGEP